MPEELTVFNKKTRTLDTYVRAEDGLYVNEDETEFLVFGGPDNAEEDV